MILGLKGRTYEEKLTELNLKKTLLERRKRFDLVQIFKILKGLDRVDHSTWFQMVGETNGRLTRHPTYNMNLVPQRSLTDIRRNFFSSRVVTLWNNLPTETKLSPTLGEFKSRLENVII